VLATERYKQAYSDDYFTGYQEDPAPARMRAEEALWLAGYTRLTGANVLEIGPGVGHFMAALKQCEPSLNLFAVEISDFAAGKCRETGATVIKGDWETLPMADIMPLYDKVDAITCIHCIEHFFNPLISIRKMAWLLPPGGLLYLHTPNHDHAKDDNWFHYHREHISMFGEASLMLTCEQVGVRVREIRKLYSDDLIVIGEKIGAFSDR